METTSLSCQPETPLCLGPKHCSAAVLGRRIQYVSAAGLACSQLAGTLGSGGDALRSSVTAGDRDRRPGVRRGRAARTSSLGEHRLRELPLVGEGLRGQSQSGMRQR